jgi:hypothetical protein
MLNWNVVLEETTWLPSSTCGHAPHPEWQFQAVVDLSVAVVLTRSDIRSITHHWSTQPRNLRVSHSKLQKCKQTVMRFWTEGSSNFYCRRIVGLNSKAGTQIFNVMRLEILTAVLLKTEVLLLGEWYQLSEGWYCLHLHVFMDYLSMHMKVCIIIKNTLNHSHNDTASHPRGLDSSDLNQYR